MRALLSLDPSTTEGGGSVSFARVLADWLPRLGIDVGFDLETPADVLLVFAHHATPRLLARHRRRGTPVLHRLDERIDGAETPARRRKHARIARLNALADMTIFQSAFVRDNVGPICRAPAARVIHNGVDPDVFCPRGPRRALEGAPAILHVTWSVGTTKRLDRIGELLAAAPADLRLYCVGRHAESGHRWLGDPRVRLLGPQPRQAVAAFMRGADVLFFPSESEPCPNTPLEAMACGLPCLYHASGGTPELIGEAGVPLGHCLRDDVARLLAERERLRSHALARATRFTAPRAAGDYATAMREAVATPPAPRSALRRLWSLCGF
jgi:glycosyltransferase involved in cell wall biosynthesis